jgi:hypothetical protein
MFQEEIYSGIPNVTLRRVLRKCFHLNLLRDYTYRVFQKELCEITCIYSAFNEGGNTTTGYGAVNISRTLQLSLPIAE